MTRRGQRPRVGLNLTWLVPGVVGGSEEYTSRLLWTMAESAPDDIEFVCFVNGMLPATYRELTETFPTVTAPVSGDRKSLRVVAENTWLAQRARRERIDLMHHLGGTMPVLRTAPGILTIHDLQPLVIPEHFSLAKRWFSRLVVPRSARAARYVVTLSHYTRRNVLDLLGVPPARVIVVPPGVRIPPVPEHDDLECRRVRTAYGLADRPLFLYPAITYPHKNHLLLLEAFSRVSRRHPEAGLVLTGGSAEREGDVHRSVERLGLGSAVFRLGRIPHRDLEALYRASLALTFPSRYEGFGIPVLEAMSQGCPVVASDVASLPEVVGDAGVLLPFDDAGAWADAMVRLLKEPAMRQRLGTAGRDRARVFDWATPARRLVDLYRRVLGEHP